MQQDTLEKLTQQACKAVTDAAGFIRGEAGKVQPGQIEEKFLNGLVSYVDRTAEEMLVERLSGLLPEAAFLTEEETVEQKDADLQWIIDPLDGTTNFLYSVPHYSVSVALREQGRLVMGIVCHVPNDELFYARYRGGAFCNGRRIAVSARSDLRSALVGTGFPYHDLSREAEWLAAMKTFVERARGVRRFGSAALDLAYVACGRFEVFYEYGLNAWDVAGGAVLVEEAGGRVSDFGGGGDFIKKREILACNTAVYAGALEVMHKSFG
jgi:myo-inositol-1(or 4)-monophosphatase